MHGLSSSRTSQELEHDPEQGPQPSPQRRAIRHCFRVDTRMRVSTRILQGHAAVATTSAALESGQGTPWRVLAR